MANTRRAGVLILAFNLLSLADSRETLIFVRAQTPIVTGTLESHVEAPLEFITLFLRTRVVVVARVLLFQNNATGEWVAKFLCTGVSIIAIDRRAEAKSLIARVGEGTGIVVGACCSRNGGMNTANFGFTGVESASISVVAEIWKSDAHTCSTQISHGAYLVIVAWDRGEGVITSLSWNTAFLRTGIVIVTVDRIPDADSPLTKLGVGAGITVVTCGKGRRKEASHILRAIGSRTRVPVLTGQGESLAFSVRAPIILRTEQVVIACEIIVYK